MGNHPKRDEPWDSESSAPESGQPPGGREPIATEEPRIASPEEDAERAARRLEVSDEITDTDDAWDLAAPDNPLRIPGESSPKPAAAREADHEAARRAPGARRR